MMKFARVALLSIFLSVVYGATTYAATYVANSCSVGDVENAINSASNGDTVAIPNGSCAWSGGISTTKQIIVRAQNYAPTSGGNATRNVTISNNSASPLFQFVTGNSFHVGLIGIRFNEGSGTANHVRFTGSGSKVPLVGDCYFEVKNRFGNQPDAAALAILSQGGVFWNSFWVGVGGGIGGQCCPEGSSVLINSPRSWNTASTMGTLDTAGTVNVYIEDSTFLNIGQSPDVDDRGRFVFRYSLIDGAAGLTHGFTSSWGGRHFEYYNNTFTTTTANRNLPHRYFWARAGHGVFFNNTVNTQNQGYGTPILLDMIVENGGTYPKARQVGWGHNGSADVSDPIYIWNNSGAGAYTYGWTDAFSQTMIQLNRDLFVNSGAKPGYAPYTYPHPLREAIGTVPVVTPPSTPGSLSVH